MRALLLVFLLQALPALAAVSYNPGSTSCSGHPCTITLTTAGSVANSTEQTELVNVLAQIPAGTIQRGDTIKLEAGKTWAGRTSNPYTIVGPVTGSSGYITVTSTGTCPADGVLITPDYQGQLGFIRTEAQNIPGLWIAGHAGGNAAHHILLKCLGLEAKVDTDAKIDYNGALYVGLPTNSSNWASAATSGDDLPYDIVVDQVCWRNPDWLHQAYAGIRLNGGSTTIENSWIDGAYARGGETQDISGWNGVGPFYIYNNYLGNAAQNLFYGGASVGYDAVQTAESKVWWNRLVKIPERFRARKWASGMYVYQGRTIKNSANSLFLQAKNSGITGRSEPSWPGSIGGTVNDNGITWERITGGGTVWPMNKNNFEAKWWWVDVRWNMIGPDWLGDQGQYAAVVIKSINHGDAGSGCIPYYSGTVNTDEVDVTAADGNPLPMTHYPDPHAGNSPTDITINGTTYTVSSFDFSDPDHLVLSSTAGSQSGVSYTYGESDCYAAQIKGSLRGNRISNVPTAVALAPWWNSQIGDGARIGGFTVENNLIESNCDLWEAFNNATCAGFGVGSAIVLNALPPAITIRHNTVINTSSPSQSVSLGDNIGYWHNWDNDGLPNTSITDTIFGRYGVTGSGTTQGHASIRKRMCDNSPCPSNVWNKNIIAGIDTDLYADNHVWNLCPSPSSSCSANLDFDDPTYGKLFGNTSDGLYVVRHDHSPLHYAKRGGTDGRDIGADMNDVPQMRVKWIATGDTELVVHLQINRPIALGMRAGYHCVAYVNTGQDYYSGSGFSGSTADAAAVVDGYDIAIPITGLLPETKYQGPWVQCPGAMWPTMEITSIDGPTEYARQNVTTAAAAAGTWDWFIKVYKTGDYVLEYDDDPAFGSPSETSPVSCSGPCTLSVTLDKGTVFYTRLKPSGGSAERRIWTLLD